MDLKERALRFHKENEVKIALHCKAAVKTRTIGQRLADRVALQKDMELVGVADVSLTLPVRVLR